MPDSIYLLELMVLLPTVIWGSVVLLQGIKDPQTPGHQTAKVLMFCASLALLTLALAPMSP